MAARANRKQSTQRKLGLAGSVLMMLLATPLAHGQGASNKAAVVSVEGVATGLEYRYGPQGNWAPVRGKEELGFGTELRTKGARVSLRTTDNATLTLWPDTTLGVRQIMNLNLEPSSTTRTQRFDISRGRVMIRMGSSPSRAVLVASSNDRYAAILQGTAAVAMNPSTMTVTMEHGAARVASSGAWVPVGTQQYVMLEPSKKPNVATLPAAPRYEEQVCQPSPERPCGIALVADDEKAKVGVRWQGLSGVYGYEIRLARDPAMRELVEESAVGVQNSYVTPLLAAGRYWFSVRGVWANGTQSAYSEPKYLRIVKVQFGNGTRLVSSPTAIVLAPGRNCQIADPAGVEASGDGQYFLPLPSTLSLTQDAVLSTLILRPTGEKWERLPLQIAKRSLEAKIAFTPRNPRWPQDSLQLTIKLADPNHRTAASEVEPTVKITINGAAAPIALKRKDNEWSAPIPTQTPPGPWVVRVDVHDQYANLLGADFVEVDGPRPPASKAVPNRIEW